MVFMYFDFDYIDLKIFIFNYCKCFIDNIVFGSGVIELILLFIYIINFK